MEVSFLMQRRPTSHTQRYRQITAEDNMHTIDSTFYELGLFDTTTLFLKRKFDFHFYNIDMSMKEVGRTQKGSEVMISEQFSGAIIFNSSASYSIPTDDALLATTVALFDGPAFLELLLDSQDPILASATSVKVYPKKIDKGGSSIGDTKEDYPNRTPLESRKTVEGSFNNSKISEDIIYICKNLSEDDSPSELSASTKVYCTCDLDLKEVPFDEMIESNYNYDISQCSDGGKFSELWSRGSVEPI